MTSVKNSPDFPEAPCQKKMLLVIDFI